MLRALRSESVVVESGLLVAANRRRNPKLTSHNADAFALPGSTRTHVLRVTAHSSQLTRKSVSQSYTHTASAPLNSPPYVASESTVHPEDNS